MAKRKRSKKWGRGAWSFAPTPQRKDFNTETLIIVYISTVKLALWTEMAREVIRLSVELNFDIGLHHESTSRKTWKTHFTASALVEDNRQTETFCHYHGPPNKPEGYFPVTRLLFIQAERPVRRHAKSRMADISSLTLEDLTVTINGTNPNAQLIRLVYCVFTDAAGDNNYN
jgi:hypothetical protein